MNDDPLNRVLSRLDGVHSSGIGYTARCPVHDDRHASLSIGVGEAGQVLMHCHVGCEVIAIVRALALTQSDLWPGREREAHRPREFRYPLRDRAGTIVAYHHRLDGDDGKRFWWQRPAGGTGLGGLHTADLPLYGSEQLAALPPGTTVVVVEGEKARDALTAAGIAAVGTVTGAATLPADGVLEVLRGYDVVLWPDNDPEGQRHMQRIAARLQQLGIAQRLVDWPDAPRKGDAADAPRESLAELIATAPDTPNAFIHVYSTSKGMDERRIPTLAESGNTSPTFLRFRTAKQISEETTDGPEALVPGLLVPGALVELTGQVKRAGKTTFTLAMVAAVLDGLEFLGHPTQQTKVVYLTEQSGRSFKSALGRARLLEREDLSILSYHDTVGVDWPVVVQFAISEAEQFGAGLLVVDTLSQFARLAGDSENDAGTGLTAVAPLQGAIAGSRLAVLLVRHDRKSGGEVGESARGTSAIDGAVDIVLQLKRTDGNRPRVRELNGIGRFDDTPDTLMIELGDDGKYTVIGDEHVGPRELAKRELLARAPTSETDAVDLEALTNDYQTIKRALASAVALELWNTRDLRRTGSGRKGSPYRYWRPSVPTDTVSSFVYSIRKDGIADETNSPLDDEYYQHLADREEAHGNP